MKELLIIIPAYNEELNIESTISELKKYFSEVADILVINDSSTDNTVNVLEKHNINYITTPFNYRYSGAVQTGFKYAKQKGYTYVAQFDGDGQHIASELYKMYTEIKKEQCDIIIGSRFKQKSNYHHPLFRKIGTLLFTKIIKIICKEEITDPTSGLQIMNKKAYERYAIINNYPEYPDANLVIEMICLKYKIKEVSVEMRERKYGTSMHSGIKEPILYMIRMMYSIFIILIKYKPKDSK